MKQDTVQGRRIGNVSYIVNIVYIQYCKMVVKKTLLFKINNILFMDQIQMPLKRY